MKIGLMLPIGQQELLAGPDRWSLFRDMTIAAEESGLDSIWCADHLLFRGEESPGQTDGFHEAWTVLTAVAAITSRVQIGPLVLCVAFRNPALTAKMATTLDEVSGGRLVLGLGCGWHEPEFEAFGYEFDHRVSQFEEALEIIVPLLRGETVTFSGRWQRAADTVIAPPGPRPGGPPLLIAGKRPRMLESVARHATARNAAWYGHPDEADELRERIARLHQAMDAIAVRATRSSSPRGSSLRTRPAMTTDPTRRSAEARRRSRTRWRATRRSASRISSSTFGHERSGRSASWGRSPRSCGSLSQLPLERFPASIPRSNLRSVPCNSRSMLSAWASQMKAAPTAV